MAVNNEITVDSEIAITENKGHQVYTGMVNDFMIPEEMTEALANIHIVLVKNLLTKICKVTSTTVGCSRVFV